MSVIKNIWAEEFERKKRICEFAKEELKEYPKGSVQKKEVKGKEYCYLVWRDKGKVVSKYIGNDPSDIERMRLKIAARKVGEKRLKESLYDLRLLEKALKLK